MPIPSYDQFIEPVLRFLVANPDGARATDTYAAAAGALGLTQQDREQLLPSGKQAVYKNRIGWAHDRLKRAGYSRSLRRGLWQVTAAGRALGEALAAVRAFDVDRAGNPFDPALFRARTDAVVWWSAFVTLVEATYRGDAPANAAAM